MAEIGFYHLERLPLDDALPRLLEKAFASGARVLLKAATAQEVERLNRLLWVYGQGSFLPHGATTDGYADQQPIYLTETDDIPNAAEILFQVGGAAVADLTPFRRVLDLFDGGDPSALTAARERWRLYKAQGHQLAYWQQNQRGAWEKKA